MAKITVTGLSQWAKVFEDNRDLDGYQGAYHDTNGRCTIEMILDEDNMQKLTDSGCMSRGKPDLEGRGTAVKLTRKFDTAYDWDGGAPKVYKADGAPWSFESDGAIGNGSEVLVELDVYKNVKYGTTTTRLERVKVLKAIGYNPQGGESGPDPFTANVVGENTPPPPQSVEEMVDEIPF